MARTKWPKFLKELSPLGSKGKRCPWGVFVPGDYLHLVWLFPFSLDWLGDLWSWSLGVTEVVWVTFLRWIFPLELDSRLFSPDFHPVFPGPGHGPAFFRFGKPGPGSPGPCDFNRSRVCLSRDGLWNRAFGPKAPISCVVSRFGAPSALFSPSLRRVSPLFNSKGVFPKLGVQGSKGAPVPQMGFLFTRLC